MKIKLTLFTDKAPPTVKELEGNEGAMLLILIDANEHIKAGGWALIDTGRTACMYTREILAQEVGFIYLFIEIGLDDKK